VSARSRGAADAPSLRARLFVGLQYTLPQHLLSRAVCHITRSRTRPLKNLLIRGFVRYFRPDMREAAQPDPLSYGSFNEFFTRALRPDARRVYPDPNTVASPVDGLISQIGYLDGSQIMQAKGQTYALEALLAPPAGVSAWAECFARGPFATLYLAPFNYHRIHMPLSGTLRAAWHVPGRLFSVNATTAACVAGLFARNERVVCLFQSEYGPFALVLVGALFVGSMSTVWHHEIPRRGRSGSSLMLDLPVAAGAAPSSALELQKGAEMGRFNMGSTVILLLPPGKFEWLPERQAGTPIAFGEPLARLTS